MGQNLNHVLEEMQRRQHQGQVAPARIPPGRTDRVCRPGPRQPRYSRSGFSDSDEELHVLYPQAVTLQGSCSAKGDNQAAYFYRLKAKDLWFNRFIEVADRRRWNEDDRLDEILPRLQGAAGEFVFGQLKREVRTNYAQLVSKLNSRFRWLWLRRPMVRNSVIAHRSLVNLWRSMQLN